MIPEFYAGIFPVVTIEGKAKSEGLFVMESASRREKVA